MGATARRVGRLPRSPLLVAACVLFLLASLPGPVSASRALQPRARLLLEDDSASPAERVAVTAEKDLAGEAADDEKLDVPVAPLPEEEVRGPELEAEIEEEIQEWEQEGGLISSVLVWSVALVAPLALLAYLRLKTNLLGGGPPGSAVLTALDAVAGGGSTTPGAGGKTSSGKTGSDGHAASGGKDAAAAAAPAPSKAALLRQLEEENARLRASVPAAL